MSKQNYMDLLDEQKDTTPCIPIGRRTLILQIAYFGGLYIFLFDLLSQFLKTAIFLFIVIYLLLALRQKICFLEKQLRVKPTATTPTFILYDKISRVEISSGRKAKIRVFEQDNELVSLSLFFERKKIVQELQEQFKKHNITLTRI